MQKDYATKFIGKEVEIEIDRPVNSKHPEHGFVYGVNYGFIPETIAPDGEAVDAYLLGIDAPVKSFKGKCIAVVHRENDDDDKVVVVPSRSENISDEEIMEAVRFQENFFKTALIRGDKKVND
ncbi:MAG: inorganic diphosphatase [Candidatus Pacebacteria bacterium]|nr:inorganic diphosphatase [Candidatus Paceibacterota bacterium]